MDCNEGAPQSLQKTMRGNFGPFLNLSVNRGVIRERLVWGWWGTTGCCQGGFSQAIILGSWQNGLVGIVHRLNILEGIWGMWGGVGVYQQVLLLALTQPLPAHSCSRAPALTLPPIARGRSWARRGRRS